MIFPSNRVRIFVATEPVDFRKGHNGLAALVQHHLHKDPYTGTVYVFRSKRADRLKLLYWDGSGLVMAYKRLEDHVFKWPTITNGIPAQRQRSSVRGEMSQRAASAFWFMCRISIVISLWPISGFADDPEGGPANLSNSPPRSSW